MEVRQQQPASSSDLSEENAGDSSFKPASGVPIFSFLESAYNSWLLEIQDSVTGGNHIQSSAQLSADMLRKGILILGHDTLASALSVMENSSIVCLRGSPSGRLVYAVHGRGNTRNLAVFLDPRYCPCSAYFTKYLSEQQQFLCNHVVAVEVSKSLGLVSEQEVPDRDIAFKITSSLQYHS